MGRTRDRGDPIPIVRTYEYLGLLFNRYLGVKMVVDHRAAAGTKALTAARRYLGSHTFPLGSRVPWFPSLVLSTLTYGGEFFGTWGGTFGRSQAALRPLQAVMNTGLRMISKATWDMSGRGTGFHTSTAALLLELDLPSVHAICAGKAARAFTKWKQTSKCWIRDLITTQPARTTGHGSTHSWTPSELKRTYFGQITGYIRALQSWHDKHRLVTSPSSPAVLPGDDEAIPHLGSWGPKVLYGSVLWVVTDSLRVVPTDPATASQHRATATAAALSRKAGAAV